MKRKHLVHRLPFAALLAPLILLCIITGYILFVSSDANVNSLFTQCFPSDPSTKPTPPLSRIPIIGPPACCLVSFFQAALDSRRSVVIMGQILAYVGALLTVTTVESARICNRGNWMIASPTASWLVFNLAGGAVVWQLAIVPAFLYHARRNRRAQVEQSVVAAGDTNPEQEGSQPALPASATEETQAASPLLHTSRLEDHDQSPGYRHIRSREVHAIPISVAFGYILPCLPLLFQPSAVSIGIWLFFPAYVSVIRQIVRQWVRRPQLKHSGRSNEATFHPESSNSALFWLYALPIACSVVAHFAFIHDVLFVDDDRTPTTRAALRFIQADFTAIGLTVLYWILLEAGWRITGLSVLVGCIAGPGAGLCVSWMARERELDYAAISRASGQKLQPATHQTETHEQVGARSE